MRFLLVSTILFFSSVANAQDINRSAINERLKQVQSIPLKHDGKEGVWFPKADAEFILDLVSTKLKLSLDIIDNQSIEIGALKSAVDGYKKSNEQYLKLADLNKAMFDVAMKHMPDLVPPAPSWYESPKATFIYGVVVGGAVVFGTTYLATKALSE